MNRYVQYALYALLAFFVWQWIGDLVETPYVPTKGLKAIGTSIATVSYHAGVGLRTVWDFVYEFAQNFWDNLVEFIKWVWRKAIKQAFHSAWKMILAVLDVGYAILAFIPGLLWDKLPVSFDPSTFFVFSYFSFDYSLDDLEKTFYQLRLGRRATAGIFWTIALLGTVGMIYHLACRTKNITKRYYDTAVEVADMVKKSKQRTKKTTPKVFKE
ncbi:MAG: hypothetical protein CMP20_09360 [Rickettsiales bacterium]|nr:hypothetical protein [Rickettsiales bacterium]